MTKLDMLKFLITPAGITYLIAVYGTILVLPRYFTTWVSYFMYHIRETHIERFFICVVGIFYYLYVVTGMLEEVWGTFNFFILGRRVNSADYPTGGLVEIHDPITYYLLVPMCIIVFLHWLLGPYFKEYKEYIQSNELEHNYLNIYE